MGENPNRIREDSCCHNCPDHRPVEIGPDGKAVTCRKGCARWDRHEAEKAERRKRNLIAFSGMPDSKRMETLYRKKMRSMARGRAT